MQYTNEQLKRTLAKMLPDVLCMGDIKLVFLYPSPYRHDGLSYIVLDTELLHLCWLVEETLTPEQRGRCAEYSYQTHEGNPEYHQDYHATWQQRTIALAKTLNIKIV